MSKYDLTRFKSKIAPRDKTEIEREAASRFSKADDALGIAFNEETIELKKPTVVSRVIRKTFSIPESELDLIGKIKDKALDKKVVLAESEVVRLGFLVLADLSSDELEILSHKLEKMPMGRPSKK